MYFFTLKNPLLNTRGKCSFERLTRLVFIKTNHLRQLRAPHRARLGMLISDTRLLVVAITRRRIFVGLLKEFDKVRRIGKSALQTDLRDRFIRRDEQQSRMHQSLLDKPTVWRLEEVSFELLFERGERTVAQSRQLLDRNIFKDVRVDNLLEALFARIGILHHLALDAAVLLRNNQIDQLGHFQILGRLVVVEQLVFDILVVRKKLRTLLVVVSTTNECSRQRSHEWLFEIFMW